MLHIFFIFFLFASAIFVNKLVLAVLPITFFVGIRLALSGILLLVYTWRSHPITRSQIISDLPILAIIAFFTTCIPTLLKAFAIHNLTAAQATLLSSIDPFVTALYAYILWQERLSWHKIAGICLGISGVFIALNINVHDMTAFLHDALLVPQLAAICAVCIGRGGWIMMRNLLRKEKYPPAQLNGLVMLGSGLIALSASWWIDNWTTITAPTNTFSFWAMLTYTIIVGNGFAYTLYAKLIKHTNLTLVSLCGLSVPLFAALIGFLYSGTVPPIRFFVAAAILLGGLLVFYYDEISAS